MLILLVTAPLGQDAIRKAGILIRFVRNFNLPIHHCTRGLRMREHRYKNVNKDRPQEILKFQNSNFISALISIENKLLFLVLLYY